MVNAPEGQAVAAEAPAEQGPGHLINDSKVGSEGKLFVGGKFH